MCDAGAEYGCLLGSLLTKAFSRGLWLSGAMPDVSRVLLSVRGVDGQVIERWPVSMSVSGSISDALHPAWPTGGRGTADRG